MSQNWFWYQLQRKTKTREIFCCDSWGLDIVGQPSTRTRILSAEHGSSQSTIDRQLNKLGLVNRHCPKVPYELTNDQAHLRVNIYKLLANLQDDRFRRHIFTGVKNGSIFVNLTKEISGFAPSRLQNLLSNNDGLNRSVWWNFLGAFHFELVPRGHAVNSELYIQQLQRFYVLLWKPATRNWTMKVTHSCSISIPPSKHCQCH